MTPDELVLLKHTLAPITPTGQVAPWWRDARADCIGGIWAEDGSHYTLVVPTALRDAIIALQHNLPALLALADVACAPVTAAPGMAGTRALDDLRIFVRYRNRDPDPGVCRVVAIDWERQILVVSSGRCTYFPSFGDVVRVPESKAPAFMRSTAEDS